MSEVTAVPAHASTSWRFARNLGAGWIGFGANVIITFFLTPYIVGTLGDTVYGLWTFLISLTGYLGLVEVGVMVTLGRMVNFYVGRQDQETVNCMVSSALLLFAVLAIGILIVAACVGARFDEMFPQFSLPEAAHAVIFLVLLGLNISLGLFTTTFAILLEGNMRFDLRVLADLIVLLVRAPAIYAVLASGYGLVGIAAVTTGCALLQFCVTYSLARRAGLPVEIRWRYVRKSTFRELFGYSGWAFLNNAGGSLIAYTNILIIGLLIGLPGVTHFSIGMMFVSYLSGFLGQIVRVLTPTINRFAGASDATGLQRVITIASRLNMLLGVPVLIGMVTIGWRFLDLWMGPGYDDSGWVLFYAGLAHLTFLSAQSLGSSLWAMGYVKQLALLRLALTPLNMGLAVLLVTTLDYGIVGVAMASLLTALIENTFQTVYGCRKNNMQLPGYFADHVARWVLAAVLFASAGAVVMRGAAGPTTWLDIAKVCAVLALAYLPIGYFVVLSHTERTLVRGRVGDLFAGKRGAAGSVTATRAATQDKRMQS